MNWSKHLLTHLGILRFSSWVNTVGILLCLFISAIIDNKALTSTSCGPLTYNMIGTISAANNIKSVSLLWQFVIIMSFGIRMLNGFGAYRYACYSSKPRQSSHVMRWLAFLFYTLEVFFLLMVAIFPSNELLDLHCSMFVGFAVCAFLNQMFRMRDFKLASKHSHEAAKAYTKLKRLLIIGNLILLAALAFSFLHFISCVSGAYSMFAAFEYIYVIYGNINFHYRAFSSIGDLNRAEYFVVSDKLVTTDAIRIPRRRTVSNESGDSSNSNKGGYSSNKVAPQSAISDTKKDRLDVNK